MSLRKNKVFLITVGVLLLLIVSSSFFFPQIIDNIITGLGAIDTFSVSVSVIHVTFDIDNREQLDRVVVNGTNITIKMPVTYYANITMNLTTDMPQGFECGFDWYINESGNIKNITVNGTEISWEADKSIKNTSLYFEIAPPLITSETTYTGDSYYEKTMVIESCAPLINVSANTSVSTDYQDYVLYLIENNTLINKTAEYHLQVSNSTASFYEFNLSNNKTFRIQAAPNATLIVIIIPGGGGGGGGGGMPLLNYTPTQQFLVEPNYINIITMTKGLIEVSMTIYNLRGTEKEFNISYTTNFVYDVISSITIPHKNSSEVPIYINTSALEPGNYTDYIYVRSGSKEENVTINLELIEVEGFEIGEEEEKLPEEEEPKPITEIEEEKLIRRKPNVLATILLILIGLFLMGAVVFFHLRRRMKTIKY